MTSRFELRLPDLGEGITEGIVGQWLAEPGSSVEEDQPLVEVETDKAVVEIPSPVAGRLGRVLAAPGAVVPVGSGLAVI
jgi:pyruvate dehydrogenase E2 component (dihydrolipoamide acetyltransferase)